MKKQFSVFNHQFDDVGKHAPPAAPSFAANFRAAIAGSGTCGFQHNRANSAVAVSATNSNIKWHITLAASRTLT